MKKISHVLFDFDGIIANTEDIYIQTWCDILTEEGKNFCKKHYINSTDTENYEQFKNWITLNDKSLSNVRLTRKEIFDKYVLNGEIKLIKGVIDIINFFKENYSISIVSNSHPELIKKILIANDIDIFFENIFGLTGDTLAKPSPDIYLNSLKELSITNNEVIAIEDSSSGINSATQADIPCYCISPFKKMKIFSLEQGIPYFSDMKQFLSYVKKNY